AVKAGPEMAKVTASEIESYVAFRPLQPLCARMGAPQFAPVATWPNTAAAPYEDRSTGIWALYLPTRHLSAKVRALIDFLAACFGLRPAWDLPAGALTTGR